MTRPVRSRVFGERFDGARWQLESIPTDGYANVNPRACLAFPVRAGSSAWRSATGTQGFGPPMPTIGGTLAAKWTP